MKKLLIICILFFSCETKVETRNLNDNLDIVAEVYDVTVYRIKIDTSVYILAKSQYGISLVKHK